MNQFERMGFRMRRAEGVPGKVYLSEDREGAAIVTRWRPWAESASRSWKCSLHTAVSDDDIGRELVCGYGPTKPEAERAMADALASLMRQAVAS